MREQFEKLPEIRDSLSEHIVFIGSTYTTPNPDFYDLVNWLNGAWYAFQEQQEKIARLQSALDELKTTCERHNDPMWRGFANDYDEGFSDCAASLLDGINRITGTKE